MTAAMPIAIPSIERNERSRWAAQRVRGRGRRMSSHRHSAPRSAATGSSAAGPARGQHAEDGADRAATRASAGGDRPVRRRGGQRREERRRARAPPAQPSARPEEPAERGEQRPPRRGRRRGSGRAPAPERLQQADLPRALGDRDQHDVHDPDARRRRARWRRCRRAASVRALRIAVEGGEHRVLGETVTSSSPWRSASSCRSPSASPRRGRRRLRTWTRTRKSELRLKHPHRGRHRHDHDLVHVHPELHAARGEDADARCMRAVRRRAPRGRAGPAPGNSSRAIFAAEHRDRRAAVPLARRAGTAPRAIVQLAHLEELARWRPMIATWRRALAVRHRLGAHGEIGAALLDLAHGRTTAAASSSVRSCGAPPMPGMPPVVSVLPGTTISEVGADAWRTARRRSVARPRRAR